MASIRPAPLYLMKLWACWHSMVRGCLFTSIY